jgi:hypothetical protein
MADSLFASGLPTITDVSSLWAIDRRSMIVELGAGGPAFGVWAMALRFRFTSVAPAIVCLAMAMPAHASLGGAYASVEADRAHMAARATSAGAGAFTVHTLTLANGGTVKEFTRVDGTVFAVAWRGPGRPDLRQLLGEHFSTLQADNATRRGPRYRRPMAVNRSDFIVQSGGHSGAFWGIAVLPQMEPPGFSPNNLR